METDERPTEGKKWTDNILPFVRHDRKELLAKAGNPQSEKAIYIKAIYDAIENLLEGNVSAIQMMMLTVYAEKKHELAVIFRNDEETPARISRTMEYAFLHVLMVGDDEASSEAAYHLAKSPSEKMEQILKAVADHQKENRTGKRAAAVLDRIRTDRMVGFMLPHLPTEVQIVEKVWPSRKTRSG